MMPYLMQQSLTRDLSAHVRATTAGSLSLDNCHPFVHGKLMVNEGALLCHNIADPPSLVVDAQWIGRRMALNQT